MNNIYSDGSIIYIFSRKEDGELTCEKIDNFRPYFYAEKSGGPYRSIFGDRARRIQVNEPYDVVKERGRYDKTFEADVHYPNRFVIDHYENIIPEVPLRLMFIDIEVGATILPNVYDAKDPIISITCWDSFTKKYYQFCCQNVKEDKWNDLGDTEIVYCQTEEQMLEVFLSFLHENFPDLLIAWGGDNFDFPYLFNRVNGILGEGRMAKASPIGIANESEFHGTISYEIAGMTLFDYYRAYRHVTHGSGQRENWTLDYIGKYELGLQKLYGDLSLSDKLGNNETLLPYNKRDVEIMVKLEEKLKICEYFNTVRRVTKSLFSDVFHNSRVIDNLLLSFAKGRYVLPTRKKDVHHEKYAGAYVKEPVVGLHEWVADFDATALYPSIVISFNISPETIDEDGEIKIEGSEVVRFRKEPLGIYPEICSYMMKERNRLKAEMLKHPVGSKEYNSYWLLQTAFKFLVNSIYGYSGFPGSRFYDRRVAESITSVGRLFTHWVGNYAEKMGYKFLYADTDSIWTELNGKTLEECIKEGQHFQSEINKDMGKFAKLFGSDNHVLELKFEKIFRTLFFGGKKRYVGDLIWKEGRKVDIDEPEFVGFEARRSDMPTIGKDFQKQFFKLILNKATRKEADDFIDSYIQKIKKSAPDDLGFPVGLRDMDRYSGEPIHVRAVKHSVLYGIDTFYPGEKIKYIFVDKIPHGVKCTDVIAFKERFPDGYHIDYDRVVDRLIWMKVRPVYEAIGWIRKKEVPDKVKLKGFGGKPIEQKKKKKKIPKKVRMKTF